MGTGSSRNRISRGLIVVLAVAILFAVSSYAYKWNRARAARASAATAKLAPSSTDHPPVVPVALNTPATSKVGLTTAPTIQQNLERNAIAMVPSAGAASPAGAVAHPSPSAPATPTVVSGSFRKTLDEARAQAEAGKLLPARQSLSAALVSGQLSPADAEAARAQLMKINDRLFFSPDKFPDDPLGGTHTVQPGEQLAKIAAKYGVTWELLCRINGMSNPRKLQAGKPIKVIRGPFHAVVSKSAFRMDLYLGSPGEPGATYVTSFGVGLGKDSSTPTGKWNVKPGGKVKNPVYYSPRGEGVIGADDPKNPLGEYWLALEGAGGEAVGKESYGIHGTIEPQSIGTMSSMGCIRMLNEDVARVYEMLVDGKSTVVVKD